MASNDILNMALDLLEKEGKIKGVARTAWFDQIEVTSFTGNQVLLHAPNDLTREIVEQRFLRDMQRVISELLSSEVQVHISTGEIENKQGALAGLGADDEYTFDQFIVGKSNQFAHAAAISVAQNPAVNYNPLFIYGQSGLGKTHLLYAIAHEIHRTHSDFRIVYVKGEDFTNELVSSIQKGDNGSFRSKYREADLLLIDDIQFIAGKERTQEEFFHTFNALYEAKKQIVLTSDRPPKEINTLEDRMKTRFEWGLLADIQPPDYETRVAIIKSKAEKMGFQLPPTVITAVAETISSNVRQLEGTVKKIKALHELMKEDINVALAKRAIEEVKTEDPRLNPTPQLIMQEVSKYYNIPVEQITGSNRSRDSVLPRQISMYLIREMLGYSLPEIGKLFSKDHTTVLHSINKIEEERKSSTELQNIIKQLKNNIHAE